MSEGEEIGEEKGRSWLKIGLGVIGAVIALVILIKISGFLLKWSLILLAIYGVFWLGRRLLTGGKSSKEPADPALLTDGEKKRDRLLEFEQDQELEEFKVRMESDDELS